MKSSAANRGKPGAFGNPANEFQAIDDKVTIHFLDQHAETQWEVRISSRSLSPSSVTGTDRISRGRVDYSTFHGELRRSFEAETIRESPSVTLSIRSHGIRVSSLSLFSICFERVADGGKGSYSQDEKFEIDENHFERVSILARGCQYSVVGSAIDLSGEF